jgi:hypothetical protein
LNGILRGAPEAGAGPHDAAEFAIEVGLRLESDLEDDRRDRPIRLGQQTAGGGDAMLVDELRDIAAREPVDGPEICRAGIPALRAKRSRLRFSSR